MKKNDSLHKLGQVYLAILIGLGVLTVATTSLAAMHIKNVAAETVNSAHTGRYAYSYVVRDKRYAVLNHNAAKNYNQVGLASWYNVKSNFGTKTASGQKFDANAMTAANKVLPLGTRVKVTNLANGRTVLVTINDRGPFVRGRIIDLSYAAAGKLGMQSKGVAHVRVKSV